MYEVNNGNFVCEVNAHKGSIMSLEYLSHQNLLASSSNDLSINFWDPNSFSLKHSITTPSIQLCMRYADWKSHGTQLLYSGGVDSIVRIYDLNTFK